jgi:ATP-dependent Lon protease
MPAKRQTPAVPTRKSTPARRTTAGRTPAPAPKPRRRSAAAPKPETLPVIPLNQGVIFPYTMSSLTLTDPAEVKLVNSLAEGRRLLALVPARSRHGERVKPEEFAGHGCAARIIKVLRYPDESLRVLVRGLRRIRTAHIAPVPAGAVLAGEFTAVPDVMPPPSPELEGLARAVIAQFQGVVTLSPTLPDDLRVAVLNVEDNGRLADFIANTINLSFDEKLGLLADADVRSRLEKVAVHLTRELEQLKLGNEIQGRVNASFSKNQREAWLREQIRVIQEQLDEEPESPEAAELRKKVAAANLPAAAKEAADRELDRLRKMHPSSPEYHVGRNYLDWLLALPWNTRTEDRLDLAEAARILDADHYGLAKIKDRILEFLAVRRLNPDSAGTILCLAGPPGVGKTSFGKSIARALGREFIRVSLGGIRDEAEIRGHRRTYIGSMPGRILQGIRRAKSANPVFMLDEMDKIGADFRGDPSAALLEALDPQQNNAFSDHYLEVPFDLSKVMFIATANLMDNVLPALRDRLEILQLPGYTPAEKQEIARRFLIPRQLENCGLSAEQVAFAPEAVADIIARYTCEAGVRSLEREIGSACRKLARKQVEELPGSAGAPTGDTATPPHGHTVTPDSLPDLLGAPKLFPETVADTPLTGVATGLAWTQSGGDVLQIEVNGFPGKGEFTLTGSLGDVMKESARIALSYVRSRHAELGIDPERFAKTDLHIHVPAGATPKDGPSAGVTLAVALASHFTGRPVRARLALTGELSLRGHVLPVGGIKEKVLAAARAGVTTVILPEKNRRDLDEISADLRAGLDFHFHEDAARVLEEALA